MTSVWKTKVLPGLNKIFDKDGKKAAAAEFLKFFNKVRRAPGSCKFLVKFVRSEILKW